MSKNESTVEPAVEQIGQNILSFEDITKVEDLGVVTVPIPEWGGSIKIRPLTMMEMAVARRASLANYKKTQEVDELNGNKTLVRLALIEPRLTAGQVDALFMKKGAAVLTIIEAINKVNGAGTPAEEAEAVKEAEAAFPE